MSNIAGYVDSPVKIFGMFFDGYMFEVVLGKKKRPSIEKNAKNMYLRTPNTHG